MTEVERRIFKLMAAVDAIAILVSMVAGPLSHTSIAIGAAVSAVIISICLIAYGLYFWPQKRP